MTFLILEILKELFVRKSHFKIALCFVQFPALILIINRFSVAFYPILLICIFDLLSSQKRAIAAALAFLTLAFVPENIFQNLFSFALLYGILWHFEHLYIQKSKIANAQLDNERRLRYQLEEVKQRLISSQREIEKLSLLKERERIARELHDSLGHTLSSLNIQLNALFKIVEKADNTNLNKNEVLERLNKLRTQVSSAIEMVRKTVYEIKLESDILLDEIAKAVSSFEFCKVVYNLNRKNSNIPSYCLENFLAIIKEALTNVCRHSDATLVEINLDLTEKYARLYVKDNGTKKENIKEGMGFLQ